MPHAVTAPPELRHGAAEPAVGLPFPDAVTDHADRVSGAVLPPEVDVVGTVDRPVPGTAGLVQRDEVSVAPRQRREKQGVGAGGVSHDDLLAGAAVDVCGTLPQCAVPVRRAASGRRDVSRAGLDTDD